jgi:hypothetical protein
MGVILIGAGYRPELHRLFDSSAPKVECAELIANRYFADGGVARPWELEELAGLPIIVHGLSGNVASAIGPTRDYLESIKRLTDYTDALTYSDHLAFTGARGRELGHLAPNRFDDELLDLACRHIEFMNEVTGRRVVLENLATKTTITGSKYTPEEFYLLLLEASDSWDCLLDLTNIWINGQNRPVDPIEFVTAIPPQRVRYIHLAGGQWIHGELVDTHSESVHPEVYDLLAYLLTLAEPQAVMVERDSNWLNAYAEVEDNLASAHQVRAAARAGALVPSPVQKSA